MGSFVTPEIELVWDELLDKKIGYSAGLPRRRTYRDALNENESLRLSTDEITYWCLDVMHCAGLDIDRLSKSLSGDEKSSMFYSAVAIRTLLESEGVYVERPGASSDHDLPKLIGLVVIAALTGFASEQLIEIDSIPDGVIGGVSSLIISIFANRYKKQGNSLPKTTWLEELILKELQVSDKLTSAELFDLTNIHPATLESEIKSLVKKQLIAENKDWSEPTVTYYMLAQR